MEVFFIIITQQDMALRVLLAMLLGSLIGYERQTMHKYAGTRTYSLVCVGSCVASILSLILLQDYQAFSNLDPARLSAQILSGIGFLGAGAIMKNNGNVSGLTTAAGLWVVATVGMAIGYGYYYLTIITCISLLIILSFMRRLDSKLKTNRAYCISMKLTHHVDVLPLIINKLNNDNISIESIDAGSLDSNFRYLDVSIFAPKNINIDLFTNDILNLSDEIKSITYY